MLSALALAIALATAACSSGPDGDSGGSGGGKAESDTNATLRFAISTPSYSFDPLKAPLTTFDYYFLDLLYDTLLTLTPDGELQPGIAESWALSADGMKLELTIAEGRTFQDGTPIDARAVKANLDRATAPGTGAPDLAVVTSVTAEGRKVTLSMSAPGGHVPYVLSDQPGMIGSPAALADLATKPVGSGPFTLVSKSDFLVSFARWPDYFDVGKTRLAAVEIVTNQADDNTRLSSVRSGQADATHVRPHQVDEAKAAGLTVTSSPRAFAYILSLTNAHPAFSKPDVRRALMHAIDRDAIAASLMDGLCEVSAQPYPKGYWARDDAIRDGDYIKYDQKRAKDLLAQAGHADGLSFTVGVPSITTFTSLAEAIQAQLKQVGIDMKLDVRDAAQYIAGVRKGQFEAWLQAFDTWRPDVTGFLAASYRPDGTNNPGDYDLPGSAELLADARRTADPDARAEVVGKLTKAALDDGQRAIPICMPVTAYAFQGKVQGLDVPKVGIRILRHVGVAKQ